MNDRFTRLLGACERLSRDETAALVRRDFDALAKTQQMKFAMLADLEAEAGRVPPSWEARARLIQLLERNRENSRLLAGMKAEVMEQLRKIRTASHQLHNLRSAYSKGPRREAFCVHG